MNNIGNDKKSEWVSFILLIDFQLPENREVNEYLFDMYVYIFACNQSTIWYTSRNYIMQRVFHARNIYFKHTDEHNRV